MMKKYFFLSLLGFCSVLTGLPIQDRKIDPIALSELASQLNIPKDADIVAETQKRWLRRPDQERWEMAELSPEQRQFVLSWAIETGFYSPWKPALKTYDKALILGATTSRMQKRLDYLKTLWDEGIHFSEIVWLTGDRLLDSRVDGLIDRCNNESEAAHILWQEANLPEEMRNLPVVFVAVPMKEEGSFLKRPTTADTIFAWLEIVSEPCTALFISDQPFCGYQFAVISAILPDAFLFDLAGAGVDSTSHPAAAAITLDSIARWLYSTPM